MSGILLASVGNSYGSLPVNVAVPTISGTVTIGSTLTSTTGTWTGAPAPTFAYQWQRGTTNISGATNSTYTIQLGDVGNTLRCVVTATNPLGSASANSANTASVPLPAIGSALGGGFYAGQISTTANSVATHYLIVAPRSSGQSNKAWKSANTATPGAFSDIDGPQNTADIVADGNSSTYPAAHFCNDASIGGFSDWYMPAKNELEVCYFNLKPTTGNNNTGSGINPNAVPARASNYTNSPRVPDQTSAAVFQSGGAEAFQTDAARDFGRYWCSTNSSRTQGGVQQYARAQYFSTGNQVDNSSKTNNSPVRAVRRFAV